MTKKLISVVLSMLLAFGGVSAFAMTDASDKSDVFIHENFNNIVTGSVNGINFNVKKAGDSDIGVVDKPDSMNKSLYMRSSSASSVSIENTVSNPDNYPLTLSFRFMLPKLDQKISFPTIHDSVSRTLDAFIIDNGKLILDGVEAAQVNSGIWHWAEIKFNTDAKYFRVSLDGVTLSRKTPMSLKDISKVVFKIEDNQAEIYLDDINLNRSQVGGDGREYYPSEIFLSDDNMESVNDILLGAMTMYVNSNIAYKNGTKLTTSAAPIELDKEIYVPLRFTAENLGAEVVWNETEKVTFVIFGGKTAKLTPDNSNACVDGSPLALTAPVKVLNGSTYIHSKDVANLLNQEIYTTEDGFVLIGDSSFYRDADTRVQNEVMHMVKYSRPTGQQMYEALIAKNPNKNHPRFFGNQQTFDNLKSLKETDMFVASCLNAMTTDAEEIIPLEPCKFVIGNGSDSRLQNDDVMYARIQTLAFMYKITGKEEYAQRAWKEMENICKFPHWNPSHYLDTGVMSEALTVGFDYIYDYLNESQRKMVVDALVEKSIKVALSIYRGDPQPAELNPRIFWIGDPFNWNAHCNLGTLMACLTVADEVDETTRNEVIIPTLGYVMRSLEIHFDEWTPDGAWQEGPGYGSATLSMDAQIIDLLNSNLGTDFGYSKVPGLLEACNFFYYMQGPEGTFNFSDSGIMKDPQFTYEFWMAKMLNEPSFAAHRINSIKSSYYEDVKFTDLMWYDSTNIGGEISGMDLDKYFRKVETAVMRSSWADDGIYAGFLAGDNEANHSQLDTGTYVLDWNGVRWVTDPGIDSYSYNGGGDYVTYRTRGEGHNTIVIDETPYANVTMENGWVKLVNNNFDAQLPGQTPIGFTISELGPVNKPAGSVRIVNAPTDENPDNKAMRISCPSTESGTQAYALIKMGEPVPSHAIEISFKLNLETVLTDTPLGTMYDTAGGNSPILRVRPDGKFYSYNGSTDVLPVMDFELDKWYDVKYVINLETQKFDVYIDGEAVCKDNGLAKPLADAGHFRIQISARETTVLIDDYEIITHPEDGQSYFATARRYDQNIVGKAYIDKFESKPRGSFAISDITDAYRDWATSAVRGVMLTSNRSSFVVRDEVKLKQKSDLYWFAHTDSVNTITVSEDGKSAILTAPDGSRMWVGIISDVNAKFEEMPAKPLPGSPNPQQQNANTVFHKLAIKFSGVEEVNVSVAYVPLAIGQSEPATIPEELTLDEFYIPDGEIPSADTIKLNGVEIDGFQPSRLTYNVSIEETDEIPVVEALADGKQIAVNQAQTAPGSATFTVEKDGSKSEYIITFSVRNVFKSSIQGYPITEDDITTSSFQQEENPPVATLDGDNKTRWAAEGVGQWIIYDFGQLREFSELKVGWFKGETRKYNFEIQFSEDGAKWITVFNGTNSGTTGEPETYTFEPLNARYLKIVGKANNEFDKNGVQNMWNNIAEVQ
ncbi:MAG: discoidin domain-containing protein [Clostridia bacterium]|nr:discoidin domain-containing protein [Clostridia bacterium]